MNLRCSNPSLLIYLSLAYLVPATLDILFSYEPDVYLNPDSGLFAWLYCWLMFAVTLVFAFRLKGASNRLASSSPITWKLPFRLVIGLLICFLIVGAVGAQKGISQWRYASEGLSASLDSLTLLYALAPNVLELILFVMLFFRYVLSAITTRIIFLLLAICFTLTASGIGPMINVLIAIIAFLAPSSFHKLLFTVSYTQQNLQFSSHLGRLILFFPIIVVLIVLGYFLGEAIKTGLSLGEVLNNAEQGHFDAFINYIVGRISVNWYSLNATLFYFVELGLGEPFSNLMAPITNAGFRLSSLTGGWGGIERPLDGSIARINYSLVSPYPVNDREGTSPGLIGTFVLAFPIWLGPFALASYLWFYNKVQWGLRRSFSGKPTLFGELLFLYFTMVFFSSPVDFLLLFDPMLISFSVLCYLGLSIKTKFKHHATIQSSY